MDTQQLLEAAKILETLQNVFSDKSNPWIPAIAAIGGALVGSMATFFPSYILESIRRKREKHCITNALISEISALLVIVKHRKYLTHLHSIVENITLNPEAIVTLTVKVPEYYSRIYQSHVDKIGVVDIPTASKIIEFHQLVDSVVLDVSAGGNAAEGGGIGVFRELIIILESAISIGNDLVRKHS